MFGRSNLIGNDIMKDIKYFAIGPDSMIDFEAFMGEWKYEDVYDFCVDKWTPRRFTIWPIEDVPLNDKD